MSNNRPTFIDLRSHSHGPPGTALPSPRALLSPRLHVAGDHPPELSPLDAFAAQSRMLARQLTDSANDEGKRMSRLPPLAITNTLNQTRPGYFRSVSEEELDEQSPLPQDGSHLAYKTEVDTPEYRPVSVAVQRGGATPSPMPSPRIDAIEEEDRGRRRPSLRDGSGFFGARTESPAPMERSQRISQAGRSPYVSPRPSIESIRQRAQMSRRGPDGSLTITGYDSRALAPPRSPFAQMSSSRGSMSVESSDDDFSVPDQHRKTSIGSSFSNPPVSPSMYAMQRSPSVSSEVSVGGTQLQRPAFNFSRPISRASEAPPDGPSRQASSDSQPSFILADDTANTPVSMRSEAFPDIGADGSQVTAAPSYVYSKFSLPRGKMLQRNSLIFQDGVQQQSVFNGSMQLMQTPPSPPSRTANSEIADSTNRPSVERPSLDPGRPSLETALSSSSAKSSSTIKAKSQHSLISSAEWPAEEHVSKAIEYHEAGALTKSTYHLRLAARQNHPTGMLLYALACRHGWGMRPNQKEGVAWLRKAMDSACLEVADDEDLAKDGKPIDILEKKTRKAQFALSIYELGVSHMNGWGIEQDKVLALRCFEIAGSWGDGDALAEAGFCYAQGVGCKKDLKKSAKFYRMAEAKGMSMVGNSWIYKAKYNDGEDQAAPSASPGKSPKSSKGARDKSRNRGIFGRKK